jgi:hypothetical protein
MRLKAHVRLRIYAADSAITILSENAPFGSSGEVASKGATKPWTAADERHVQRGSPVGRPCQGSRTRHWQRIRRRCDYDGSTGTAREQEHRTNEETPHLPAPAARTIARVLP